MRLTYEQTINGDRKAGLDSPIARSILEFVPGKQVTLAHLIAHPTDDVAKKIGIMTLTPGETAMIGAGHEHADLCTPRRPRQLPPAAWFPQRLSLAKRSNGQCSRTA